MMILAAVQFGINVALIWVVIRLAHNYNILKSGLEEAERILDEMILDSRRANKEAKNGRSTRTAPEHRTAD